MKRNIGGVYLIALPGKRPPEGIFCYESIKVVQYNNYLIGGETHGFLNYIFRLGGGGIICYELIKMCSIIFFITVKRWGCSKTLPDCSGNIF